MRKTILIAFLAFASLAFINAEYTTNEYLEMDEMFINVTACSRKHPVVLVPGLISSIVEGRSRGIPPYVDIPEKCKREFNWMRLWINAEIVLPSFFPCFEAYFTKHWQNQQWVDTPGMDIRVPGDFGDTYPVDILDPTITMRAFTHYFHEILLYLKKSGYELDKEVVAAPYDWREIPNKAWASQARYLIEKTVRNMGEKAVVVCHSMGSIWTYYLLMSQSQSWRDKYVHKVIFVSPAWAGAPNSIYSFFAGYNFGLPGVDGTFMCDFARNTPSEWVLMPTGFGWPDYAVLAETPNRTYSYSQVGDILRDVGMKDWEKKLSLAREPLRNYGDWQYTGHPGVPVTAIIGKGIRTGVGMRFKNDLHPTGEKWEVPEQVLGDGDGTVPLPSLNSVCDRWKNEGKSCDAVYIQNGQHKKVLKDKNVLEIIRAGACE